MIELTKHIKAEGLSNTYFNEWREKLTLTVTGGQIEITIGQSGLRMLRDTIVEAIKEQDLKAAEAAAEEAAESED